MASASPLLRFGEFTLDTQRRALTRGEERVHLTEKPFATLLLLVTHQGQVVSKRTLMDEVWRDTIVTEDNLVQAVSEIRRTLGDDKENPRYVQTVPREGYRFLAPVEVGPSAPAAPATNDALPGATVTATSAATRARSYRWLAIGSVVVAVAALGLWNRAARPPVPLDANLITVAPFEVLSAPLALWETGMASVLSANLDGAGPLRTTPPSAAIGAWVGPPDRAALGAFARRSGAGLALGGRLLRVGTDSVRLWATLVDARNDEALFDAEIDGHESQLAAIADSLTMRLLRELGRDRAIGAVRRSAIGSTSMTALRAFLRGEQFYRAAQWDSALAYHKRAVAEDSTFAPALRRIAHGMSWLGTVHNDSVSRYLLAAGRFNRGLARRESLLVQAESLSASLEADAPGMAWWTRRHRLQETLDEARRSYPDDPEVWNAAGEAAFHYGEHPTTNLARARASFDRAIALDSAFTPAYVHAVGLATRLGDAPRARAYALALARGSPGLATTAARAFLAVTAPAPDIAALDSLVRRAGAADLFESWAALKDLGDSAEVALALTRRLAAGRWTVLPYADSGFRSSFLVGTLIGRGHVREAARLVGDDPETIVELALVGAMSATVADRTFEAWLTRQRPETRFALPWWSTARDSARIQRFVTRARLHELATGDVAAVGEAYLLLARGDSTAALRAFESLPDSLCVACGFVRLTRAQLLLASHQEHKAAQLLADELSWIPQEPALGALLWELYRGIAAERLRDLPVATRAYGRVIRMWRDADPELVPFLRQAQEGLARLNRRPG